jgi:hypothetical protein
MRRYFVVSLLLLLCMGTFAHAQFAGTGTSTLSVVVGPEAALSIVTGTTNLAAAGSTFANPFTGTTNFNYKVRTTPTTGSGTITVKVTADFGGVNGPSVASPPTAGDALSYTCAVTGVGTACSSATTASTTAATNVVTFAASARSSSAGDSGTVSWSLTNDPRYSVGTYTATVTFTISAA